MLLTCILPILLFTYRAGYALPVHHTPTPANLPVLAVNDSKGQLLPRTLFGVAWSCVLTVFICAWTSVHPNVPPRGRMGGLLARVKLMFWTIVAPELVLAWAVRQWFAAREIRDIYNRHIENRNLKRWTIAHGHFLEMGGFALVSDRIHQFKETELPGWLSMSADWNSYNETVRQREHCQLGTLTLERFKELVGDPNVVFPAITPAEINDRSKGDGLSKLLAILQTSWFILQCVARGFEGLALTELELVTLAMASLNAITFAFWWSKPLGVQEPVNVYVTEQTRGLKEEKADQNSSEVVDIYTARDVIDPTWSHVKSGVTFIFQPEFRHGGKSFIYDLGLYLARLQIALLYIPTYPVFLLFALGILFLLWVVETKEVEETLADETVATKVVQATLEARYQLTYLIRRYFGRQDGPLGTIADLSSPLSFLVGWFFLVPASFFLLVLVILVLSPVFLIFFTASLTFTAAFEIVTTNKTRPGATHVHEFYAPRTNSDRYSRMIVFAFFGAIFGGIHCIAWNFAFPTNSERSLWRYTSLVLTAIPLVVAPIDYMLENVKLNGTVGKKLQLLLAIFMTVLLFVYVPARLCLIAQALALLRDQPESAYFAVNWTKYIPHLFN